MTQAARQLMDASRERLGVVSVSAGAWKTGAVGTSTTATVQASDLGLPAFAAGQDLVVISNGVFMYAAGASEPTWTPAGGVELGAFSTVIRLQSSGANLYFRGGDNGSATYVYVGVPI